MRWAALFLDLESRLAQQIAREEREAAWDMAEAEMARLGLADRLRGGIGAPTQVRTRAGQRISGELAQVGEGFILIEDAARSWLVPLVRIAVVRTQARSREASGGVLGQVRLGQALRALARAGWRVRVSVEGGEVIGGHLRRVGSDHIDLDTGAAVVTIALASVDYIAS